MTGTRFYPKADAKTQSFASAYPGDIMPHPNVLVLHTTEGTSWPGYSGGAVAPTLTAFPDAAAKALRWRQHFPINMSARALVNKAGGVQTNTLNVVQVELVGTCAKGGPGLYWPEAPDWALKGLADFLKWLHAEWPVPLRSTSRPWVAYPASYGTASGQRMGEAEWMNFSGICGHQHVPENVHGDPGAFPIARLLAMTAPTPPPPTPSPTPTPTPAPAGAGESAMYFDVYSPDVTGTKMSTWIHVGQWVRVGGTPDWAIVGTPVRMKVSLKVARSMGIPV